MKKTAIVFGSAPIKNYKKVKKYLKNANFYIFCDGGMFHQKKLRVKPNLIVGDFDSYPQKKLPKNAEILKLPCEKDDTDVFFAVKEACKRGFENFILFGVVGKRFDHSLVNISALLYLKKQGKTAILVDDYSEMQIFDETPVEISPEFKYFSILCVENALEGVYIKNAKYPLENATIAPDYQFGISNQVVPGKKAQVFAKKGNGLLVKVF